VLEVDGCCASSNAVSSLLLCPIASASVISSEEMFSSYLNTGFNLGLLLGSNSSSVVSMAELDASSLFVLGFFSSLAGVCIKRGIFIGSPCSRTCRKEL